MFDTLGPKGIKPNPAPRLNQILHHQQEVNRPQLLIRGTIYLIGPIVKGLDPVREEAVGEHAAENQREQNGTEIQQWKNRPREV